MMATPWSSNITPSARSCLTHDWPTSLRSAGTTGERRSVRLRYIAREITLTVAMQRVEADKVALARRAVVFPHAEVQQLVALAIVSARKGLRGRRVGIE